MSHAHHDYDHLKMPDKLQLPSWYMPACIAAIVVGLAGLLIGFFVLHDPVRTWKAYLIGLVYFTLVAISGPFFLSTQYLTRAGWSATVRRVSEAFTPFIVPAGVLALIYCFGAIDTVYEWSREDIVTGDKILEHKAIYLNANGMIIRTVIAFTVWSGLGLFMFRNSLKQDEVGGEELIALNGRLSPLFIVTMALCLTMFSVDYIMSLHPHWFSTMWTVNVWVTMWQAGLCLATIIVIFLHKQGKMSAFINANHVHDMSKLVFAITAFWGYIAFCQFLLMWYANLPEEAIFWNARMLNGWGGYTLFLAIGKFVVPFFLMLPRDVKRGKGPTMMILCGWLMVMCAYEIWWWVAPAPAPPVPGAAHAAGHAVLAEAMGAGDAAAHVIHPYLPWLEVLVFAGFAGLFALVVGQTITRINIIPAKDPVLQEALNHHQ